MNVQAAGSANALQLPKLVEPVDGPPPAHVSSVLWFLSSPSERADLLNAAPPQANQTPSQGSTVQSAQATATVQSPSAEALARKLVRAGGSGDTTDVELVVGQLKRLPVEALQSMIDNKVSVIACRGSITDHATALQGVKPRGWPPGSTWDIVPGGYRPAQNEVVIATRGHGTPTGAHVPATGQGHGSYNLVIHEAMHAVDAHGKGGKLSGGAAFTTARAADLGALSVYQRQPAPAGPEETYAESAARFYGGDPTSVTATPALDAYWRSAPFAAR